MKKKIIILGSTGSIGKILVKTIKENKKIFSVVLLSANKNYKLLLKQAKLLNVKNLIISDEKSYKKLIKININKKIKVFNDFDSFERIIKKKVDYSMSSISGLAGLAPTLKLIKYTNKIAIANKEAIICGWNLINKELINNKTKFIPVDSEHFSIWYAIKNNSDNIDKIFLTASGGPFYNLPLNKFKNIKVNQALKHPNWKMGKKITIDSATLMNKVFEIIEAKKIFNVDYKKLSILIHPKSYVHAIINFNNGMKKIIVHDTSMKIPIYNSLYSTNHRLIKPKKIDLQILNNLSFKYPDKKKFPMLNILKKIPKSPSLYETLIVSANDEYVNLFIKKKIQFVDIYKKLSKFLSLNEFIKLKKITPKKIDDIINLDEYVRLKIRSKDALYD